MKLVKNQFQFAEKLKSDGKGKDRTISKTFRESVISFKQWKGSNKEDKSLNKNLNKEKKKRTSETTPCQLKK